MYLTYSEYQDYGGTLEESAFNRICFKAQKKIDSRTFGRLTSDTTYSETIKRLMFEIIGLIGNMDTASEDYTPGVTSEGNDGYSVSYAGGTIMTIDTMGKAIDSMIEEYLRFEKTSDGKKYLLSCGLSTLR